MQFRHIALVALVLLGFSRSGAAQSPTATAGAAGRDGARDGVVAMVDVRRLPIDLRRIQREFQQTSIREERDGLSLRYFVDVYATAPPIVLFTPEDNLVFGPAPYGAPTHMEMLQMMTPREFRASGMMLGGGIRVPREKKPQGK
jgi:hypothetical protein